MKREKRFLTVKVDTQGNWHVAICKELKVSGLGSSLSEALAACGRSMQSSLKFSRLPKMVCHQSSLAVKKKFVV